MLFAKKKNTVNPTFNDALAAIASALATTMPGTAEYDILISQATSIQELMTKNPPFSFKPSPDALLTTGVTLLLAVITIKHEALNTITSKAWGLLPKLIK